MRKLGILMERNERPCAPRTDNVYASVNGMEDTQDRVYSNAGFDSKGRIIEVYGMRVASAALDSDSDDSDLIQSSAAYTGGVGEHADICRGSNKRTVTDFRHLNERYRTYDAIYDGQPLVLMPNDAAWIPVKVPQAATQVEQYTYVADPIQGQIEAVPGIWGTGKSEGLIYVTNPTDLDAEIDTGSVVGELVPSMVQT